MCSKLTLCLILGLVAAVVASSDLDMILEQQHKTLQAVLLATRLSGGASTRSNDVDFQACYLYYASLENEILAKYKDDMEDCTDSAILAKSKISEENAGIRSEFVSRSDAICQSMKECDNEDDIMVFYQCYNQKGSSGASQMYSLSSDSSDQVSSLKIQYQKIDNDKDFCNSEAKKTFNAGRSNNTDEYTDCLLGLITPPPLETTTSAPSTESSTVTTESSTDSTTESSTESTTYTSSSSAATTEDSNLEPEEDVLKLGPMTRMNMWNFIRNVPK